MKTEAFTHQLAKWSPEYNKLDCAKESCYGLLAVHRACFALTVFHAILSASLIGVDNTRDKRAAIQNGWWGPKVLMWLVLLVVSFFIPNEFFIFWGDYITLVGACVFIVLGLILLVDFAHSWSETCLEKWENSEGNFWQIILVGSTAGMYAGAITLTGLMYGFFAAEGCTLNRFFISINLALCIVVSIVCIHPSIQEANPRSGLAQASMVAIYCTYLTMSAVANHSDSENICNPLRRGTVEGARKGTVVIGAIFTFLAIAYSTSRAATQSKALVGNNRREGAITLGTDGDDDHSTHNLITSQPGRTQTPRYQALLAAVEAGAIPASALDEEQENDDDDDSGSPVGDERDDERTGTKYNYSWFHIIFVLGCMYVGMLLTDWQFFKTTANSDEGIYIGRSHTSMWMRVISSWLCIVLYIWSLVAPVLLPDRFGDI